MTNHKSVLNMHVEYITHNPIDLHHSLKEVGFGEWSSSMDKDYKIFKRIEEIQLKTGDFIYVCNEGTYIKYEVIA